MARADNTGIIIAALAGYGAYLYWDKSGRPNWLSSVAQAATPRPLLATAPRPPVTPKPPTGPLQSLLPRGIRNNNPLNIEYSVGNNWVGQTGSDGRFAIFDRPVNGIRAGFVLLRNYCNLYALCTIRGVISRWAPSSENDTAAYIAKVVAYSGIAEGATLVNSNAEMMTRVVRGMIEMENGAGYGNYYGSDILSQAFAAAQ